MNDVSNCSKVLLVLPSISCGGMERVMSILANEFVKNDISVCFFLYSRTKRFYKLDDSIHCFEPEHHYNFFLINLFYNLLRYKKVCKLYNPNAVLSFGQNCNIETMIANLFSDSRLFISDRGNPYSYYDRFYEKIIRKICSRKLAGIIQQSQKAKEIALEKMHCKNVVVIGNPINQIDINVVKKAKRENIVLSVGRFIKTKNYDLMIECFCEMASDWKLVIVGDGPEYNKCCELVESHNAQEKIFLPGESNNTLEYYLKSKVFAFTSSSEGFPNVIGEALASGLPVVSFDCVAGPSEMIINGFNGYLVKNFDKNSFCDKLNKLMNDANERTVLSNNAVESVKKFSSEVISQKFLEIIL